MKNKNYYFAFNKRFIGLGFMISYKDNPITYREFILIEFRFLFLKTWYIKNLK